MQGMVITFRLLWDVISHVDRKFNGASAKHIFMLGHGWVIA